MANEEAGRTVLGKVAEKYVDGEPVVLGTGRELRGRVVVADKARQQVLFPPPSDATIRAIRASGTYVRSGDFRRT